MRGSLDGCWYERIETARTTGGGVYLESGTELFVGRLDGGPAGTFTTTYKFEAKLNADGAEVRGRCQHPIVSGSGTGGFQAPPAESISRTSSETRSPSCTGATSVFVDPALTHGQRRSWLTRLLAAAHGLRLSGASPKSPVNDDDRS